jgi:large subunit ribosomal protein L21
MAYNQSLGVVAAGADGAVRLPRPRPHPSEARRPPAAGGPKRTQTPEAAHTDTETTMYAIVKSGGKQYRVERGQTLLVERLAADEGASVTLQPLLYRSEEAVFDKDGLKDVKVTARVLAHVRGEKLRVFKFKPKRGYKRRTGHRQDLTRIEVTEIAAGKAKAPAKAKAEAKAPAAAKAPTQAKAAAKAKAADGEGAAKAKPVRASRAKQEKAADGA